jgi:hypothetical protein
MMNPPSAYRNEALTFAPAFAGGNMIWCPQGNVNDAMAALRGLGPDVTWSPIDARHDDDERLLL